MSDEAKPLTFTLADHDALKECVGGIKLILEKFGAIEKKQETFEARLKVVEDWKIKVMAMVLMVGVVLGYIFAHVIPLALPVILPSASPSAAPSASPSVAPSVVPSVAAPR